MFRSFRSLKVAVIISLLAFAGCGKSETPAAKESADGDAVTATEASASAKKPVIRPREYTPQPSIYVNAVAAIENPIVVMHTSAGDIKIELELERSPQTVLNFLENYVRTGFYEQTVFHFADANSFVMGGGFTETLEAKETRNPVFNESNNGLSNVRGTIAMSRDASAAHSATSQFFINVQDNTDLDFQGTDSDAARGYCVFGRVIEGMEVVDKIAQSQIRQEGDFERLPVESIVIQSIEEVP
ncbi:MAG TPA: peptidylprolyl isomerase [Pirellulaceae bacterium]|nr:peptidylprolyl isomerase [Pirellulaceae bacterium]